MAQVDLSKLNFNTTHTGKFFYYNDPEAEQAEVLSDNYFYPAYEIGRITKEEIICVRWTNDEAEKKALWLRVYLENGILKAEETSESGGGGGDGDVVGPPSALAGEVALYADTTGKLLTRDEALYYTAGTQTFNTYNLIAANSTTTANLNSSTLSSGLGTFTNAFVTTDLTVVNGDLSVNLGTIDVPAGAVTADGLISTANVVSNTGDVEALSGSVTGGQVIAGATSEASTDIPFIVGQIAGDAAQRGALICPTSQTIRDTMAVSGEAVEIYNADRASPENEYDSSTLFPGTSHAWAAQINDIAWMYRAGAITFPSGAGSGDWERIPDNNDYTAGEGFLRGVASSNIGFSTTFSEMTLQPNHVYEITVSFTDDTRTVTNETEYNIGIGTGSGPTVRPIDQIIVWTENYDDSATKRFTFSTILAPTVATDVAVFYKELQSPLPVIQNLTFIVKMIF